MKIDGYPKGQMIAMFPSLIKLMQDELITYIHIISINAFDGRVCHPEPY